MPDVLLAAVRYDCGGELRRGTERTERGLRWTFTCERCGGRWGHRDGAFCPLDRDPVQGGGLAPAELALLACFRRLPEGLRSEVVSCATHSPAARIASGSDTAPV